MLSFRKLVALVIVILILAAVAGVIEWTNQPRSPVQQTQALVTSFNNNDFSGALSQIDTQLAQNPNDADLLIQKASVLAQEGSLTFKEKEYGPQAIQLAQQALAIDPKNDEAWRIIGYANEIMQDYPAAHEAYQRSLALNPQNVLTISQEAHAYDLQGNTSQAEAGYGKALSIDPKLDQANIGMGRLLFGRGDLTGALPYFQKVVDTSENVRTRAEGAYSAGVIQGALGNAQDAQTLLRQATQADPTYPLGWTGLGEMLFQQAIATSTSASKDDRNALITEAFDDLQKAITINPYQSQAILLLGTDLAAIGQTDAATQILQKGQVAVENDITLDVSGKQQMQARISAALSVLLKKNSHR